MHLLYFQHSHIVQLLSILSYDFCKQTKLVSTLKIVVLRLHFLCLKAVKSSGDISSDKCAEQSMVKNERDGKVRKEERSSQKQELCVLSAAEFPSSF